MQQPVALLEQGLEPLSELVFVDLGQLLQEVMQRAQFLPETLRLRIGAGRAPVSHSPCRGYRLLAVLFRVLGGTRSLAPLLSQRLAALLQGLQLGALAPQLLTGALQLSLQLLLTRGTRKLKLLALPIQRLAALLHRLKLSALAPQLLTGALQVNLQLLLTCGTRTLTLLALPIQRLAALLHRLQLGTLAPQLFTGGLKRLLQVVNAVLPVVAVLLQLRTTLAQAMQIALAAFAVLTRRCQGGLQLPELGLVLLLLQKHHSPLLILELLHMGELQATGLDDLLGLIKPRLEFALSALMALDQIEIGEGRLAPGEPQVLLLIAWGLRQRWGGFAFAIGNAAGVRRGAMLCRRT